MIPLVLTSLCALSGPAADDLELLMDRWDQHLADCSVPGLAVAVVANDEVVLEYTWGQRDEAGRPVGLDTVFYIASVTKTFTATAVAQLADEGRLELDDPVVRRLPRFQLASPEATTALSLRDLLSHRQGLSSHPAIVFNDAYSGQITEDRFYRLLRHSSPSGSFAYNNLHFVILGRVVEECSGRPWRDFLRERIFEPLGMDRSSGFTSDYATDEDVARGLTWDGERWVDVGLFKDDATMHAAGGLCTTVLDLTQWIRLHLNDGEVDGEVLLQPQTARAMREPQVAMQQGSGRMQRTGCGLGWMIAEDEGRTVYEHGGGYVGFSTHVSFVPEFGVGVAVVSNNSGPGGGAIHAIAADVYDALLGGDGEDLWEQVRRDAAGWKRDAARQAARASLAAAVELSRPIEDYAGTYSHPDWGDVELVARGRELDARIGNLRPPMQAGAEVDAFVSELFPGRASPGRFVLEGEKVVALVLERGDAELRFVR